MMTNLNLKLKSQYKEEPIKSPRNMTPQNQRKATVPRNEPTQLKTFIRAYRKEVQLPINFQTSIFLSKTPQRCLQHNNVITLYCVSDKKPLCAHCMYQVHSHVKHEIIPLNKANSTLRQQLNNTIKDINQHLLPSMNELIKKSHSNLENMDKEMSHLTERVNKFYNELLWSVNEKRNEQISKYQNVWSRLRYEYSTFSNELGRINQYINEKLKQLSEKTSEDSLLYYHNLAMYLRKMDHIIAHPFGQYQPLKIQQLYGKMDDATQTIKSALAFPTDILKEQATPSIIVQKEASHSLKKDKMSWMVKKNEGMQKNISPKKIQSPRSPNIISPITQRQTVNKDTKYKFLHKDKSLKSKVGFEKTLKNRKSETNVFFTQK